MANVKCKICGSKTSRPLTWELKANVGISGVKEYDIKTVYCDECDFTFQPIPFDGTEIYRDNYVGGKWNQFIRFYGNMRDRKRSALSFSEFIRNEEDFSILEVGCSSGYNIRNINKKFPRVSTKGIDLDIDSIKYGKSKGLNLSNENMKELDERFDIVFLNHVFEHIDDIKGFAEDIQYLLKDNGLIVINVPSSLEWGELPYWEHVNYFSVKAIRVFASTFSEVFSISTNIIHPKTHFVPEIRLVIGGVKNKSPDMKAEYVDRLSNIRVRRLFNKVNELRNISDDLMKYLVEVVEGLSQQKISQKSVDLIKEIKLNMNEKAQH